MEDRARIWNDYYASHEHSSVRFDDWIARHMRAGTAPLSYIEFGCGFGFLSERLLAAGHAVLSTDLSAVALKKLKERVPAAQVMVVDLKQPLPFPDGSYDGAVADLCLHYFSATATAAALEEIARILKPGGCLFARVNSAEDVHYGAGEGLEMEPGFYNQAGHYKRFFDKPMIDEFFRDWKLTALAQYDIRRHDQSKNVFEIVACHVQ